MASKWSWSSTNPHSKIHKLYYAYSLEHSPPVYVLFVQLNDGSMKKFSDLKELDYSFDKEAFEAARDKPREIPVPVPDPTPSRERGPSCTIC